MVEIITGVERRRRWRLDEKLRIVAEAEAPGACFVEVARRYDVSRGLLWNWRRQVRSGELRSTETRAFLPVQVMPDAHLATSGSVAVAASASDLISSSLRARTIMRIALAPAARA